MTAATDASTRARGNVRRGKTAEQAVARYLRTWWPNAVRAVRTGSSAAADPGDIAGVPFIVSVKDCVTERIGAWFDEVDAMVIDDPAALSVVVQKRRGAADPAQWWAWLYLDDLGALLACQRPQHGGTHFGEGVVRMRLGDLVVRLRDAGYAS